MKLRDELKLWEPFINYKDFPNILLGLGLELRVILVCDGKYTDDLYKVVLYILKGWARDKLLKKNIQTAQLARSKSWCVAQYLDDNYIHMAQGKFNLGDDRNKFNTESEALIAGLKEVKK